MVRNEREGARERLTRAVCLGGAALALAVVTALLLALEPKSAEPDAPASSSPESPQDPWVTALLEVEQDDRTTLGEGDALTPLPSPVAGAAVLPAAPEPIGFVIHSGADVVSPGSLMLVLQLDGRGAQILEVVPKTVPYRRVNARSRGHYRYQLEDDRGRVLHEGQLEIPEVCPLQGGDHVDPHVVGHVVVSHDAQVLLRIPDLAGARAITFTRTLPEIDVHPLALGRASLRKERSR